MLKLLQEADVAADRADYDTAMRKLNECSRLIKNELNEFKKLSKFFRAFLEAYSKINKAVKAGDKNKFMDSIHAVKELDKGVAHELTALIDIIKR